MGVVGDVHEAVESCVRVVEQIDAFVVEWVRQPVTGAVHGKHAPVPGERREDRHPIEGTVSAAVR